MRQPRNGHLAAFTAMLAVGLLGAGRPAAAEARAAWFTLDEISSTTVTLSDRTLDEAAPLISIEDCLAYRGGTLLLEVTVDLDKLKVELTTNVTSATWQYALAFTAPGSSCETDKSAVPATDTCFVVEADKALEGSTGVKTLDILVDLDDLMGAECESGTSATSKVYVVMEERSGGGVKNTAVEITVDLQRPRGVTISSVAGGDDRLEVSWDDDSNTAGTVGYRVYWSTADFTSATDAGVSASDSLIETTSYSIEEGVSNDVEYYVAVAALDEDSENASELSARVPGMPVATDDFWEHFKAAGGREKGDECFVATAAWGTPMAAELGTLRSFRDRLLIPTAEGRWFVAGYYRWGPHAAEWIRDKPAVRAVVRVVLTPLVWFADLALRVGAGWAALFVAVGALALAFSVRAARRVWLRRGMAAC